MAGPNTPSTSSFAQSLQDAIKAKQEETRRKAEEEAAAAGEETEVPVVTAVPVTRQRIYGDIVEREEELKKELEAMEVTPTPDEFGNIPPGLGPVEPDTERASEIRRELAKVQTEKEDRYAKTVGGEAELARIREIESQLANLQDIPAPVAQNGQPVDPFFYRNKRNELEEELKAQKAALEKKGVRIGVDESGQRVSVMTATPEMAGDDLRTAMQKTLMGVSRGFQLSGGVDPKEATPLVRDEDELVNLTADLAPILATAPTGTFALAKLGDFVFRKSPKIVKYLAPILAPAGTEALVATEETGTLMEDVFDMDKLNASQKKFALMAEALGVDATLDTVIRTGSRIGGIPVIGAFVQAIPTLLLGGRKGAEDAAGKRMADLLYRSERAPTPEARADALAKLRQEMSTNFEAQTGVKFDDYLKAAEQDAKAIQDGADAYEVQQSGAVATLIPADKFMPMTTDIIETVPALQRLGAGVAGKEGLPEVTGARARQDVATFEQTARVAEPTLPPTEQPRTPQQIETQAETAGSQARSAINQVVEGKKEQLSQQAQEVATDLEKAVSEAGEQLVEGPAAQAAQTANIGSRRAADEASEGATELFRSSYTRADDARREAYDTYTEQAAEIEIPAPSFQRSFEGIVGEKEIGNVVQLLIDRQPLYAETLQQLERQNAALARAIDEQVFEIARGMVGPQASPTEFQKALDSARTMVDVDAAKEAAGYKDVTLDNVEGLLAAVNSELRSSTGADRVALTNLSKGLNNIVDDALSGNEELAAVRDLANSYYMGFQSVYKLVPSDAKTAFKYGDNITEAEMAGAQKAFRGLLRSAVGDDPVARQNLINIRSQLNPQEAAEFNKYMENFFLSDIYAKRISVDLEEIASETDPKKLQQVANQVIKRLRDVSTSDQYAYLDEFAPGVRAQLQRAANDISKVRDNVGKLKEEADKKSEFFAKRIEETAARPEAAFAEAKAGSKFGINSVKAAAKMLQSDDAAEIFTSSWEVAGLVGEKGLDGLTEAQRNLKTVMAQGVADMLLTDRAQLLEKAAGVSFPKLNRILKSPAFNVAFPEGDPTRKSIEQLAAITKGLEARRAAKETGESITGTLKTAENLVDNFIRFEQGPLSREGRRQSMIARAFFAVVGGRARMGEVLTEAMVDPAVAARILKDQEDLIRQGLEDPTIAYKKALGRYMMQRLGVTSMDELNEEVQAYVIANQMEDMGITEPAQ